MLLNYLRWFLNKIIFAVYQQKHLAYVRSLYKEYVQQNYMFLADKRIVIWGATPEGEALMQVLAACDLAPEFFVDDSGTIEAVARW
ncbi:hypothetical protein AGMMS50276_32940 [Synergistales bacterium]|nr:hypothetical protein AGMMS50276_32940 [Synergistales bacterium]